MTTTTMNPIAIGAGASTATRRSGKGLFARMLDHMIASREAEARRLIARQVAFLDEAALAKAGFTRADFADWHAAR